MTTFTYSQLEQLWTRNGGSALVAPVAAAIAMAESSGRSDVTSSNPDGGVNVGPWQLDTRGVGAGYSVAQLQNPDTNARVAIKGSNNGSDWSPWATFASGAYKKFLQGHGRVPLPGGHGGGGGVPAAGGSLFGWPGQIIGFFTSVGTALDWLLQPNHWVRIMCGVLGVGATGAGVWMLSHSGGTA
jgi:Lysozyme like domain